MIECTTLKNTTILIPKEQLTFRLAVYGVVLHRNELLLMRGHNSRRLWFPGGGINPGESIEITLRRELREETGIKVDINEFLDFREEFFYHDIWKKAFHSFRFYYLCHPLDVTLISDDAVLDGESESPRWYRIETLSKDNFDQSYGFDILQLALRHSSRNRD